MKKQKSAVAKFAIDGALTIRNIDGALQELRGLVEKNTAIEIDATRATEVDVTAIQLVLAARASARKAGKTLTMAQPIPEPVRAVLAQGGFFAQGGQDTDRASFWLGKAGM